MSNRKRLIQGSILSIIGLILSYILIYTFNIIMARKFGAEVVGQYSIALAILSIAAPIAMLGLNGGIMRYLPMRISKSRNSAKGVMSFSLLVTVLSALFFGIVIYLLSSWLASTVFNDAALITAIKVAAMILPFYVAMGIFRTFTFAYQKTEHKLVIEDIINKTLLIAVLYIVLWIGFGVSAIMTGLLLVTAITVIMYGYTLSRTSPLFDRKVKAEYDTSEMIRFSLPLIFSSVILLILAKIDTLMLGYYMGSSDVGIYSMAVKTAWLLLIGLNAVNQAFSPMISSLHKEKKYEELKNLFHLSSKWIVSIALPGLAMILLYSSEIIGIFGPGFVIGSSALIVLAAGQAISAFGGTGNFMLTMIGRSKLYLANQVVTFILNIILNIMLIPRYGIVGAAIATGISIAFMTLLKTIQIRWLTGMLPLSKGMIMPVFLCIGLYAALSALDINWIIGIALFSAAYIISYIALCLDADEKDTILSYLKIMKKRKK